MWQVYLLECADGTFYCGVTTDIERRVEQHNGLRPGGARYTRSRRPVRLVASRPCPDHSTACKLENLIHNLPRRRKLDFLAEFPLPSDRKQEPGAQLEATVSSSGLESISDGAITLRSGENRSP